MTISVTQALNNSFAEWYCDVPKALRWIPGLGQSIETRRAVKDNVSSFTLATVNHRGTEGEIRREVSLSYMDEMTIYIHGTEAPDGGKEIKAIFKGEEVVHRLSLSRCLAIKEAKEREDQAELRNLELKAEQLRAKAGATAPF